MKRSLHLGLSVALLAMLTGRGFAAGTNDLAGEISALKAAPATTNSEDVIRRDLQEDLLKEKLSDQIFKSFKRSQGPLDGMLVPMVVPQQRSLSPSEMRRLKDRKNNWNFSDGDAEGGSARMREGASDLDSSDATERDTLAILKRQYRNEEAGRLGATNQFNRGSLPQEEGYNGDERKEFGLAGQDGKSGDSTALRGVLNDQALRGLAVPSPNSIFSAAYAPSAGRPGAAQLRSEQRSSDFRKLLEGGDSSGGLRSSALNPLGEPAGRAYSTVRADTGGGASLPATMPTMPTMSGYNPSLSPASSLSPAFATPAATIQPLPVEQPRQSMQFTGPSGPPRRQF